MLDTNVVSELMRDEPDPNVYSWLEQQEPSTLYLASFTLAEIRNGIACLPTGHRRTTLTTILETGVLPAFGNQILAFDEPSSREYARHRATARAHSTALSNADAIIAAIASAPIRHRHPRRRPVPRGGLDGDRSVHRGRRRPLTTAPLSELPTEEAGSP